MVADRVLYLLGGVMLVIALVGFNKHYNTLPNFRGLFFWENHPAVLNEPEPLVLVENLGQSTVNLRVYFWLDGGRLSWLKVKSSVIRLVKRAFQDSGISLPDEAREVTFPQGVPVRMIEGEGAVEPVLAKPTAEPETVATKAEASLQSEAEEIKEQARRSWTPGENLLTSSSSAETG
jgi:small conductance mechanosensitive channel